MGVNGGTFDVRTCQVLDSITSLRYPLRFQAAALTRELQLQHNILFRLTPQHRLSCFRICPDLEVRKLVAATPIPISSRSQRRYLEHERISGVTHGEDLLHKLLGDTAPPSASRPLLLEHQHYFLTDSITTSHAFCHKHHSAKLEYHPIHDGSDQADREEEHWPQGPQKEFAAAEDEGEDERGRSSGQGERR